MNKTTFAVTGALAAATLMTAGAATAKNFGDWMNPSKWFGNDRDYYDRDYYGRYGPGWGYGGYPGWGYGGYPGWGYGGYPGGWGYPYPQQQAAPANNNPPPPPPAPQ